MVTVGSMLGLAVLIVVNTFIAAVATRFFRLALSTKFGTAIYTLLFVPALLVMSTLVLSGVIGLGVDLQDRAIAAMVTIAFPFAIAVTIDYVWVASPADVAEELAD